MNSRRLAGYAVAEDYVARTDEKFAQNLEVYSNANEMIMSFKIDNMPLLSIIDDLSNVDIL